MNKVKFLLALTFLVGLTIATDSRLKYKSDNEEGTIKLKKQFVLPTDAEVQSQWSEFKNKHGKQFKAQEEALKYKKFTDNYNFIQAANADHENNGMSLRLGVNQFADLSPEEWFAYSHGTVPGLGDDNQDPSTFIEFDKSNNLRGSDLIEQALPASIDHFALGNLNPPKNQGSCGSCWAFSATGALEGLYKIKNPTKPLQLFSQQQVLDCTNKATSSWGMYGCSGGSIIAAFKYFSNQSIALAGSYPYKAKNGSCYMKSSMAFSWKNANYANINRNNSIKLKTAVATQPVAASLWASTSKFQLYKSGVYTEAGCGIQKSGVLTTNHGILISGYGYESTTKSYYWIVQNSWGTAWGNKGYIWVGYTPDSSSTTATNPGTCGIHLYPAIPTVSEN